MLSSVLTVPVKLFHHGSQQRVEAKLSQGTLPWVLNRGYWPKRL